MTHEQQKALMDEFVIQEFVSRGMIADVAIHEGIKSPNENPHAIIMLTTRQIEPLGFGNNVIDWHRKALLLEAREQWAKIANKHMQRAGLPDRIGHRSYEAQGIERQPSAKLGPRRTRIIRQIQRSLAFIELIIEAERRKSDPFSPELDNIDSMLPQLEKQIDQLT